MASMPVRSSISQQCERIYILKYVDVADEEQEQMPFVLPLHGKELPGIARNSSVGASHPPLRQILPGKNWKTDIPHDIAEE